MKNAQRGAALIETALALPVILVALYGLTWVVRAGTVSERAESAVRYAGVVSAQQNPYHDYSLYAVYNNLGATSNVQTLDCVTPNGLYLNGGTLPVVIPGTQQTQRLMPSFWQPKFSKPYCDKQGPQRQPFIGASRAYLLLQSVPAMQTLTSDGGYFGLEQFGAGTSTEYRFYRSPDLATLMHCVTAFGNVVSNSLARIGSGAQLYALQASNFSSTPVSVNPSCTAGIGSQVPVPTPAPPIFTPGALPSETPFAPSSPSPQPSPSASVSPSPSPKPSVAPSAAASPTPASSPTSTSGSGGGGSGGGGGFTPGGTPTPSSSPTGKGGTPTPSPVGGPTGPPTGSPTAAPSQAPVTPAPSKAPSTPVPTAKPTTAPTAKPQPTATPQGPPGAIS